MRLFSPSVRFAAFVLSSVLATTNVRAAHGFRLPPGFEITPFAGDALAHDIFALTMDPRGDVVVSGPGYIKILRDENHDGIADSAKLFSSLPRSCAQGLYFDGNDLLATGDGAVLRFRDADGNGVADGAPEVVRRNMGVGEHGTHAVVQGPDGWIYIMCGNSPLPQSFAINSPASPVTEARQGTLLRFNRDFSVSEAVVHGFRNSYDFDFLPTGQMMVYDSDSERAHHLPGYAPTRVYDAAIGEHHGYMLNGGGRAWLRPEYVADAVERTVELGRGSPTGVLTYRHRQFPERYRHGVFLACWSLGTIYFVPLTPRGTSFDGEAEKFLVATGTDGFAPVDLEVGPSGDLFVAIGGRGTQGGVFRIRYTGAGELRETFRDELAQVLTADQPLSAWSRARWVPLARKLGASRFETAAVEQTRGAAERIRALEVLVEVFGGVSVAAANQLAQDPEAAVKARLAWALSRGTPSAEHHERLASLTAQPAAVVQRAAWEGLLSLPPLPDALMRTADWQRGLASPDRRVRRAAITAAQRSGYAGKLPTDAGPARALDALWVRQAEAGQPDWMRACLEVYKATSEPTVRNEAVRLMQIGLGDLRVTGTADDCDIGYTAAATDKVAPVLRVELAEAVSAGFPSGHHDLDHEVARLLGILKADRPGVAAAVASFWTEQSAPADDLHFLHVAVQLPGARAPEVTRRTAHALAGLEAKMDRAGAFPDRLWPQRLSTIFQRLNQADPRFAAAFVADPAFGRPSHSQFLSAMTGEVRAAAARKLLATAESRPSGWSPELIEAVGGALPASAVVPILRGKLADPSLRDAASLMLMDKADSADRERLIGVLAATSQPGVAEKLARGLAAKPGRGSSTEISQAVRALGRHAGTPSTALALDQLLATWTGREPLGTSGGVTRNLFKPWVEWFSAAHPAEAENLAAYGGMSVVEWMKRLGAVNWSAGDAARGATVFRERACATCHQGASRLGPALTGITARFNRDDLFLHIVEPNLAISPTYAAQDITLRDGTVHFGVPVYQSVAITLLEVAPNTTIRLTGDQIASATPARRSAMPEGLLIGATDSELADLYTYLQTLVDNPNARKQ